MSANCALFVVTVTTTLAQLARALIMSSRTNVEPARMPSTVADSTSESVTVLQSTYKIRFTSAGIGVVVVGVVVVVVRVVVVVVEIVVVVVAVAVVAVVDVTDVDVTDVVLVAVAVVVVVDVTDVVLVVLMQHSADVHAALSQGTVGPGNFSVCP